MALAVLRAAPSSPHVGQIEFGPTKRSVRDGCAGRVAVEYDGDVFDNELDMISVYAEDMIAFFDTIGRPGWNTPDCWFSEFDELIVDADPLPDGLVRLGLEMWWSRTDDKWLGELIVRQNDLSGFAARLRVLTNWRGEATRFLINRDRTERLAARTLRP